MGNTQSPVPIIIIATIEIAIAFVYIIAAWNIYKKAGKPGWASIVPFYNVYVLLKIVGRPGWWLLLFLIPVVNIIISLLVAIDLAKAFGRSTLFGVLALWLFGFVGYLILGFGKSQYKGLQNTPTSPQPAAVPSPALEPAATPQTPPTAS